MTGNRKTTINLTWLLALAAVFTVLKLTGVIDWSWSWVLFPALLCAAVILGFVLAAGIFMVRGKTTVKFYRVRRGDDR